MSDKEYWIIESDKDVHVFSIEPTIEIYTDSESYSFELPMDDGVEFGSQLILPISVIPILKKECIVHTFNPKTKKWDK